MLGLKGTVENLDDGRVKIVAEGDEDKLKWFEEAINIKENLIQVSSVEREYSEPRGDFRTESGLIPAFSKAGYSPCL